MFKFAMPVSGISHVTNDTNVSDFLVEQFQREFIDSHRMTITTLEFTMSISHQDLDYMVRSCMQQIFKSHEINFRMFQMLSNQRPESCMYDKTGMVLVISRPPPGSNNYYNSASGLFMIRIYGIENHVENLRHIISDKLNPLTLPQIRWHYISGSDPDYTDFVLPVDATADIKDEFYPWLTDGVDNYLDRYIDSKAAIMLIGGQPGTGKTSLLRYMLNRYRTAGYSAHVAYDERIFSSDDVFIGFYMDPKPGFMMMEDADLLITSREHDGNKLISRFLNVSDGIIPNFGKKMIFTTNLSDYGKIDPALVRPGRCFDFMHCREFTAEEAAIAAEAAGVPNPGKACTLAQLFNDEPTTHVTKMGFV
jgi:hypothetical protein